MLVSIARMVRGGEPPRCDRRPQRAGYRVRRSEVQATGGCNSYNRGVRREGEKTVLLGEHQIGVQLCQQPKAKGGTLHLMPDQDCRSRPSMTRKGHADGNRHGQARVRSL